MFNVLGQPIDGKGPLSSDVETKPIHREAPTYAEQRTETEILKQGLKL